MVTQTQRSWDALADRIKGNLMEAHRGVLRYDGRFIIFGNDGYASDADDTRARREVEMMREWLSTNGYTVEAFATDTDERYTWILIVSPSTGLEKIDEALWKISAEIFGPGGTASGIQRGTAANAIDRVYRAECHLHN